MEFLWLNLICWVLIFVCFFFNIYLMAHASQFPLSGVLIFDFQLLVWDIYWHSIFEILCYDFGDGNLMFEIEFSHLVVCEIEIGFSTLTKFDMGDRWRLGVFLLRLRFDFGDWGLNFELKNWDLRSIFETDFVEFLTLIMLFGIMPWIWVCIYVAWTTVVWWVIICYPAYRAPEQVACWGCSGTRSIYVTVYIYGGFHIIIHRFCEAFPSCGPLGLPSSGAHKNIYDIFISCFLLSVHCLDMPRNKPPAGTA